MRGVSCLHSSLGYHESTEPPTPRVTCTYATTVALTFAMHTLPLPVIAYLVYHIFCNLLLLNIPYITKHKNNSCSAYSFPDSKTKTTGVKNIKLLGVARLPKTHISPNVRNSLSWWCSTVSTNLEAKLNKQSANIKVRKRKRQDRNSESQYTPNYSSQSPANESTVVCTDR